LNNNEVREKVFRGNLDELNCDNSEILKCFELFKDIEHDRHSIFSLLIIDKWKRVVKKEINAVLL